MITADQAYNKSLLYGKLIKEMSSIESGIKKATEMGVFNYTHSVYGNYKKDEEEAILQELKEKGFHCVYKPIMNSSSCPPSQMDYYSSLFIDWEKRKK